MDIKVEIRGDMHTIALNDGGTGKDLLSQLHLKTDGTILIINGKPLPYNTRLKKGDYIKIIRVASGG